MVDNKIIALINGSLAGITNVPVIQEENKSYKPTLKTDYIRCTILPSEPTQATIGFDRTIRWGGLYQLDYFTSSNTTAIKPIIDTIIKHFNDNRFIQDDDGFQVTITMAWRGVANTFTDWYRTPIMLRYEAFTTQN